MQILKVQLYQSTRLHLYNRPPLGQTKLKIMWSNYILTSFRSLQRNKFFVGINLVSIAIAFALCTIAWFNLQFNGDFNKAFANADIIYKVNAEKITANGQQLMGTTPLPLAAALNTDLDGVMATSYVRENQLVKVGDQLFRESVGFADQNFFKGR